MNGARLAATVAAIAGFVITAFAIGWVASVDLGTEPNIFQGLATFVAAAFVGAPAIIALMTNMVGLHSRHQWVALLGAVAGCTVFAEGWWAVEGYESGSEFIPIAWVIVAGGMCSIVAGVIAIVIPPK